MEQIETKEITLEDLKSKIKSNSFESKDFFEYYNNLQKTQKEFLSLVEWASEIKRDNKELKKLCRKLGVDITSDIMEEIRRLGFGIQSNKDISETFTKSAYRLLELTRARKRNDVFYGITRIFISHNRNVPDVIAEAFKPYYDDETFQCFMYAFLSAVTKSEKNERRNEEV